MEDIVGDSDDSDPLCLIYSSIIEEILEVVYFGNLLDSFEISDLSNRFLDFLGGEGVKDFCNCDKNEICSLGRRTSKGNADSFEISGLSSNRFLDFLGGEGVKDF